MAKRVSKQTDKSIEPIPVTTVPHVVNRVTVGLSSDAPVRPVSNFDDFIEHLDNKTHVYDAFPSFGAYHAFRKGTGIETDGVAPNMRGNRGLMDTTKIEYGDGSWDGVRHVLQYLWTKYMGDKIGNQMVANFVFTVLLNGVEQGWASITKAIREKLGDDAVKDTESIVDGINKIVIDGGAEELKNRINEVRTDITKPTTDGKKPNVWQKILRGLRFALSVITFKK
jgi:hypothetical protein